MSSLVHRQCRSSSDQVEWCLFADPSSRASDSSHLAADAAAAPAAPWLLVNDAEGNVNAVMMTLLLEYDIRYDQSKFRVCTKAWTNLKGCSLRLHLFSYN